MISWDFKTHSTRPIGLDIGHHSIKMIQLETAGEQLSVLAADEVRIDTDISEVEQHGREHIISVLKKMIARGSFNGRRVVSCLPSGDLKITSLRLTEAENEKTEQTLRKEIVQRFGFDPEKDALDYINAGTVRQGDEVKNEFILFATDNETIKDHIEMLEQAGLRPVAIDTIPCALFRSFNRSLRRQEDREKTVIFVDIGNRFTTVVFGRKEEISFIKQIQIGAEKFNQEVAAQLGISSNEAELLRWELQKENGSLMQKTGCEQGSVQTAQRIDTTTRHAIVDAISKVGEKLAKEISLCMRYYTVTFRGKRVERAIFTGGGSYEKIMLDAMRRQLPVRLEVAQPLRGFDLSNERTNLNFYGDRRGLLCEWAVAVGLSLKGYNGYKNDRRNPNRKVPVNFERRSRT